METKKKHESSHERYKRPIRSFVAGNRRIKHSAIAAINPVLEKKGRMTYE